jgi:hypothetical protein
VKNLPVALAAAMLLPLAHSSARAQQTYGYDSWSAAVDTLRSVVVGQRYNLSSSFLVPGSERVTLGPVVLLGDDYDINYRLGVIRVRSQLPEQADVVVSYRKAPFTLNPVYSLRDIEFSDPGSGDSVTVIPTLRKSRPDLRLGNLVFGGTKSISFTVGNNRGTSLDQSLQASIEGQLTPTIKVRALLSDNNLPVQPEGNTEELEYLDKVYVEIEGPHARTALGDFGFENNVSTFSPITRQLKGVSAEAWVDQGRVVAAGAKSKGEFRTMEFRGTTGLQGPYELLSASRNTGEVIIAGTERVYFDGRRLARGQNRDYTIDYDMGTITFTPGVLVTNDSEIAVDFEVTQERYDRSTLFTAAESQALPGMMDLDVVFAREKDDMDSPRNQTFNEQEKQILRDAGDDPSKALTSGVTPVDPGKGDYVLVPPDTLQGTPAYFEYDSLGSYVVSFVEVGQESGDYRLEGINHRGMRYYRFAGSGAGNFVVGRRLPLPESVTLVSARLRRERGDHLLMDAEWNVSEYDKNTFSSAGDADNQGNAARFQLGLKDLPFLLGRLKVTGSLNMIEDRFKSFDKSRPAYFYRDWNLENVALVGRETIQEYAAALSRGDIASLRYSLGRIDRLDVSGNKQEATVNIGRDQDRALNARAFDTRTERPDDVRLRRHMTASAAFGMFGIRPSATWARERYLQDAYAAPDSGLAYELFRVRLSDRSARTVNAAIELENRDTEEITSRFQDWTRTRRDRTVSAQLAVRHGASVQGELQLTHREEKNLVYDDKRATDLARLKGFVRSVDAGVRVGVDYEISQTAARTLIRSVIFVGEGNGDYNEQGDLVGKGKGAFNVLYSPTTNTIPTKAVNLNLRFSWKSPGQAGSRFGGRAAGALRGAGHGGVWSWLRSNVSLDQTITISEESTFDSAWRVYLMMPGALQRDNTTVYGTTHIRQDWTLLDGYPNVSLNFRFQRRDEEDNRFEGVHENRFFGEHLVRLSRSLSLLTLTGEASREIQRRDGGGIDDAGGAAYDIVSYSALGGAGVLLPGGSSLDLDLKYTDRADRKLGAEQTLLTLRPRTTWRLSGAISVFASYDITRAWDASADEIRPVVFARRGDAHRWNVTPTIRLAKHISLVAAYNGRRETVYSGRRITDHELKIETRAFF